MRKDIKKRLEKALTTLREPRGATVPSIIKIINNDSPVLSLRKVLEALQEGINEGFLCMYNSRFKLRRHLPEDKTLKENRMLDEEENMSGGKKKRKKTPESDLFDDDSELDSDDGEGISFQFESQTTSMNKKPSEQSYDLADKNSKSSYHSLSQETFVEKKKTGFSPQKSKSNAKRKKSHKYQKDFEENENYSVLGLTSKKKPEHTSSRSTVEKVDMKKQRGPRCTSMKKDVRMPSKVHIPFSSPLMPQKTNNFNDLLRRSPDPLNGPLYDNFTFNLENLGLFRTSY